MSRIPPLLLDELPEPEREAVDRAEELMGFMANDALTMARNRPLMRAFGALVGAVYAPGKIDPALKRMIGFVTSSAAGCRYCVAHTAFASGRHGVAADKLAALWSFRDSPLFDPAEKAALEVALHAGQSPNGVTDEMFARLDEYYDIDAQLEIVAVISMFGFLNRWNSTLATDLESAPAAAVDGLGQV